MIPEMISLPEVSSDQEGLRLLYELTCCLGVLEDVLKSPKLQPSRLLEFLVAYHHRFVIPRLVKAPPGSEVMTLGSPAKVCIQLMCIFKNRTIDSNQIDVECRIETIIMSILVIFDICIKLEMPGWQCFLKYVVVKFS